jgi:uncharacterized membrane protein YeiH
MELPHFTIIIDYLGTLAFALSGIRAAGGKDFDLFGAYVVGLVTATGGGTLRDLLLGVTPFWMTQPAYLIVTGVALLASLLLSKRFKYLNKTVFLLDAVGLGLFVVVGVEKTLEAGYPTWVAITMGMITGSVGGVIRDVLVNEVPLLFRRDIYALACVAGGIAYALCLRFQLPLNLTQIVAATVVIISRLLAVRYHIRLPAYQDRDLTKKIKT